MRHRIGQSIDGMKTRRLTPADAVRWWHLTPQTNKLLGHPALVSDGRAAVERGREDDPRRTEGAVPPGERPSLQA